jgi:hypothetical protein
MGYWVSTHLRASLWSLASLRFLRVVHMSYKKDGRFARLQWTRGFSFWGDRYWRAAAHRGGGGWKTVGSTVQSVGVVSTV